MLTTASRVSKLPNGSRRLSTYFAPISPSRFGDSGVAHKTFDCSTEVSGHETIQQRVDCRISMAQQQCKRIPLHQVFLGTNESRY